MRAVTTKHTSTPESIQTTDRGASHVLNALCNFLNAVGFDVKPAQALAALRRVSGGGGRGGGGGGRGGGGGGGGGKGNGGGEDGGSISAMILMYYTALGNGTIMPCTPCDETCKMKPPSPIGAIVTAWEALVHAIEWGMKTFWHIPLSTFLHYYLDDYFHSKYYHKTFQNSGLKYVIAQIGLGTVLKVSGAANKYLLNSKMMQSTRKKIAVAAVSQWVSWLLYWKAEKNYTIGKKVIIKKNTKIGLTEEMYDLNVLVDRLLSNKQSSNAVRAFLMGKDESLAQATGAILRHLLEHNAAFLSGVSIACMVCKAVPMSCDSLLERTAKLFAQNQARRLLPPVIGKLAAKLLA